MWDNEVWGPEWLGQCETYLFKVRENILKTNINCLIGYPVQPQRNLNVRLTKTGTDDLIVDRIKVKTTQGTFLCAKVNLKNNEKSATRTCVTFDLEDNEGVSRKQIFCYF